MLPTSLVFTMLLVAHHASCLENLLNYSALFVNTPRKDMNFIDMVSYDNYRAEAHWVTTKDGYILTLFHIYPSPNCTKIQNMHILMMHGLYLSADDCIIPGPGVANCYLLADACYHIWVGNNRGNKYSRNHSTLDPDTNPQFWDFNFDHMALLDMPAIIDYILIESRQHEIYYIGHSQGVTIMILLCAQVVEYNDKIKFAIGLSTATWMEHTRSRVFGVEGVLSPLNQLSTQGEILQYGGATQKFAEYVCASHASYPICSGLLFTIFGCRNSSISPDTITVAVSHEPSGTSLQNFLRWGQIRMNGFSQYDYGPLKNLATYGTIMPAKYDLSNYKVETIFVTSNNDYVSHPEDLDTLLMNLPNCKNCSKCILSNNYFCHLDYIYSKMIPKNIFPIMLAAFRRGHHTCT